MLNSQANDLLQQFLTMPDPTYAEIFEARQERDDLAEQLEVKASEYESLESDLADANTDKADKDERIKELELTLADALSLIAGDVLPSDLAETDKEFGKLYAVL
jgi:hypothetical protein